MILQNSVPLANLARIGKLKTEPPDARERAGLLHSATVRLQDARQTILSLESRFDLAYNAAHAAALSALRWHGYRSEIVIWYFNAWNIRLGSHRNSGSCSTRRTTNAILPNMKENSMSQQALSRN